MARPKQVTSEDTVEEIVEKVEVVEKTEHGIEQFDVINGFVLENHEKLNRVVEGVVKNNSSYEGGLLEQYKDYDAIPVELVLAHYDRLGGYITTNVGGTERVKIKTGSFWDFKRKRPFDVPEVKYMFKVGGDLIEVKNPSDLAAAATTLQKAVAEKELNNKRRRENARRKSITRN